MDASVDAGGWAVRGQRVRQLELLGRPVAKDGLWVWDVGAHTHAAMAKALAERTCANPYPLLFGW